MSDLPTTDELLNSHLPTTDQLLSKPAYTDGDYSGPVADNYFTDSAAGHGLTAFGQGVSQAWGAADTWSKETDEALKKWGVYNDYNTGKYNLIKGLNEAWMRPVIHGASHALLGGFGVLTGLVSGAAADLRRQGRNEDGSYDPTSIYSGASELLGGAAEGAFGASGEALSAFAGKAGLASKARSVTNTAQKVMNERTVNGVYLGERGPSSIIASRARGTIGEGERGYFNSVPVSVENLDARLKAAKIAGMEIEPPGEPILDPHFLARKMNPDLFQEWDRLHDVQENLRLSKESLDSQSAPDIKYDYKAERKLEESRVQTANLLQENSEKIRDLLPKIGEITDRLETTLASDSAEAETFRKWSQAQVLEAWFKRQDLEHEIDGITAHAESLVPSPTETLEIKKKQASQTKGEGPTEAPKGPEKALQDVEEVSGKEAGVSPVINEAAQDGTLTSKIVEGTGSERVRGTSKTIEAEVIEQGLSDHLENLPEYRQISNKDQAAKASKFISDDYEKAKRVALGLELPPDGLLRNTVFKAFKDIAKRDKDAALYTELARSETVKHNTLHGQELQALATKDKFDPVNVISDVEKALKANETQKMLDEKTSLVEAGKKAIDDFKDDWDTFLDFLECK